MLTVEQLAKIMPQAGSRAALYLPHINSTLTEFKIDTPKKVAAFLATLSHESGQLKHKEENLNYSAQGLMLTWPSRFKTSTIANAYARQPEKIANKVYADRVGNGNEASGDGWRYRGAGFIQLTFKGNQSLCAKYFKMSEGSVGDWLRTPEGACRSAGWFWMTHGCNEYAEKGDFDAVSDAVNLGRQTTKEGDAIGYADRLHVYNIAKAVLGVK